MVCPRCQSNNVIRAGTAHRKTRPPVQRYICHNCNRQFVSPEARQHRLGMTPYKGTNPKPAPQPKPIPRLNANERENHATASTSSRRQTSPGARMSDAAVSLVAEETPPCAKCGAHTKRLGFYHYRSGEKIQRFHCKTCKHTFVRERDRAAVTKYKPGPNSRPRSVEPEPVDKPVEVETRVEPIKSGTWRIKQTLSLSLAAMFRSQTGFTPDQVTMDTFVSQLLESEVA